MDTAVPQAANATPTVSPDTWLDADAVNPEAAPTTDTAPIVGGPQMSQPPADASVKSETPQAATVRRVATGVAGLGLVAAAVVATKILRGANAAAGANVVDYDG